LVRTLRTFFFFPFSRSETSAEYCIDTAPENRQGLDANVAARPKAFADLRLGDTERRQQGSAQNGHMVDGGTVGFTSL
jgi:hypothetical protein